MRAPRGFDVDGPLPADTVFVPDIARRFDAIVAMYHDQGLPVLKAASFGHGVNVTLGLPFVRTSVDHGTALDLAADAALARTADPGSLFAAVDLAIALACAVSVRARMHSPPPRKRFGQNFLADPHYVARIVDAIAPREGDNLVEIGPGLAALTGRPDRARRSHRRHRDRPRSRGAASRDGSRAAQLALHEADALEFDFAPLGPDLRVVGNLPYNISSPLLFHLAANDAQLADMHVMLQREVVARMAAEPATPDYGRLTVMLQARFRVTPPVRDPAGRVPAGARRSTRRSCA